MQENQGNIIRQVRTVTWVGLAVNVVLSAVKFAAGILYQSQALVADAVHSLSDLITDVAVIVGVKYWSAPPDKSHPYGHEKIETIVTALIGLALALVGLEIGWNAILSIYDHNHARPGLVAFLVALASVIAKEVLYRWTVYRANQVGSAALAANAWHHRSDAISSIPVVVAIAVSYYYPNLDFLDRVGAIIVSMFILHSAWVIVKPTLLELTDAADQADNDVITSIAATVPGIISVHAVRTRSTGSTHLVDMHIMVDPNMTVLAGHKISHDLKQTLLDSTRLNISDVVVHLEPYDEKKCKLYQTGNAVNGPEEKKG